MPSIKVAFIILNYRSEKDTCECLESLRHVNHRPFSVILVDNASGDSSGERIAKAFPEVEYIANKVNSGFAAGNNIGIMKALGDGAEYILMLNNDTVVENDFIEKLITAAKNDPQIGILCPKIYFCGTRKLWYAGGYLNKTTGFTYHRGEDEDDQGQYDCVEEVDFASGCVLLAKKEVFEKVGLLDEDYYHSHEDADLCLRAKEKGFKVTYVPQSVVYHKLAVSSGGRRSPFYLYYRTRNHLIFHAKRQLKAPLFWPKMIFLIIKRVAGSMVTGQFMGARATLAGVKDFYAKRWGKGRGDIFR